MNRRLYFLVAFFVTMFVIYFALMIFLNYQDDTYRKKIINEAKTLLIDNNDKKENMTNKNDK